MYSFLIVGAGQAGLQLSIGLLKNGYSVTLISDKSAADFLSSTIFSTQGLFDPALQNERDLDLNFYESLAPKNSIINFTLLLPDQHKITFQGELKNYFQAIDQRLKFARWLDYFLELGGDLIIKKIILSDLEQLIKIRNYDLILTASGKGELGQLFKINKKYSIFDRPQRRLSAIYLTNIAQPIKPPGMHATIIPNIGEFFTMSGLSFNGYCEMLLFEGIEGGAFDLSEEINTPEEQLIKTKLLLEKYLPTEAERYKHAILTDPKAVLSGGYMPVVRHPIAYLPHSKKLVLGIGDAVVLNDPIAGQGANNASMAAKIYLAHILEHIKNNNINKNNIKFTEEWMQETFEHYWSEVEAATQLSNLLLQPMPKQVIALLYRAMHDQKIANQFARGFENPRYFFDLIDVTMQT